MKKPKLKLTTINIPVDMHKDIKRRARIGRRSMAELIRLLLEVALEKDYGC